MYPLALRIVAPVSILAALVAYGASGSESGVRRITGGVTSYTVADGETLRHVSARFGIDPATIAAENGLKADAGLQVGQRLRIDNRHVVPASVVPGVIVINVPQRMLFYGTDDGPAGLPVAVGQPTWRTPTLPFSVMRKETNPTWDVPVSIQEEARRAGKYLPPVVPPGPKNPLGQFWLGLSIPNVGVHGTNAPASIYRATTHGCIRVGPQDIAWLFPRVTVGTTGQIIYEPILLAAVDDEVFLEVHADIYRRLPLDRLETVRTLAGAIGAANLIDWDVARRVVGARDGIARPVGTREKIPTAD